MVDGITVELEGAQQAMRNIQTLERKMVRRIVSAGVRAGNKEIRTEARMDAPVRTGQLRRQIRASVKMNQATGTVTGTTYQKSTKKERRKGQRAHAIHLVVGGTKPHDIPHATFQGHSYALVHHPGTKPNPFMERAAHRVFGRAVSAFNKAFKAKLDAEVHALPKR